MEHDKSQTRAVVPVPRRYLDRKIVGTREHVDNAVALLEASGRLIDVTEPRPVPGGVMRIVRFTPPVVILPPPPPAWIRRRWPLVAAAVGVGIGLLAGLGWAVARLAAATVANLPTVAGVLTIALLVTVLLLRARSCRCAGWHCSGCPR